MIKCPECKKECNGAQGLGRHRAHAHGIAGKKSARKSSRKTKTPEAPGVDIMLAHLFPDGIPPRKIKQVLAWVKATEELVR